MEEVCCCITTPVFSTLHCADEDPQLFLGLVAGLVCVALILLSSIFLCLVRSRQKLLLSECGERSPQPGSILYPGHTLDLKPDYTSGDTVSWASLQKPPRPPGYHAPHSPAPASTAVSNIYDLPFSSPGSGRGSGRAGRAVHYSPLSQSTRLGMGSSVPGSPALSTPRHAPRHALLQTSTGSRLATTTTQYHNL